MTAIDVSIEHVWKQYRLGPRRHDRAFWALRDVTFEVPRGAAVGIIGANGAGKSTLLKLLAGITAPTRGRLTIHGRLAALIEVGSGFHPELTGRENVFLSGAILGMRQKEIAAKLPSIVDFAGVERFVDTPVKWYSSGMYVRLGFSIAAHLEPDVLLVDEVLAVGDAEFQAKCLRRIHELRSRGVTILFISHDLTTVEQLCDTAVLLEKGEVAALGDPTEVVSLYHRRITASETASPEHSDAAREGLLTITNLLLRDPVRPGAITGRTGHPLIVSMRCRVMRPISDVLLQLSYFSADGRTLLARTGTSDPVELRPPGAIVEFTCPTLPLRPGAYCLTAVARRAATGEVLAWWDGSTTLHVEPGVAVDGQFHVPHTWRLLSMGEDGSRDAESPTSGTSLAPPSTRTR